MELLTWFVCLRGHGFRKEFRGSRGNRGLENRIYTLAIGILTKAVIEIEGSHIYRINVSVILDPLSDTLRVLFLRKSRLDILVMTVGRRTHSKTKWISTTSSGTTSARSSRGVMSRCVVNLCFAWVKDVYILSLTKFYVSCGSQNPVHCRQEVEDPVQIQWCWRCPRQKLIYHLDDRILVFYSSI